jgi:hypothetical protein
MKSTSYLYTCIHKSTALRKTRQISSTKIKFGKEIALQTETRNIKNAHLAKQGTHLGIIQRLMLTWRFRLF